MPHINQTSDLPRHPRPIIMIGAGGIVNDAHLPAYKIAGFEVAGIYDLDHAKASALAAKFAIRKVFESIPQLIEQTSPEVVYDLAIPGSGIISMLQQLPEKSAILIQKPMGDTLEEARAILKLTKERHQLAAVNFQLRYAPFINAARSLINAGVIGELCDIEVNVNVYTPWHLWKFLYELPRVEILYHSIHYVDLVRSFLGNPPGVYAKTTRHPGMKELASVRTNMIMDYGDMVRANIITNHCHKFGSQNQHSYIKFEGTHGAIKIRLGLLMDYPKGAPDLFEYVSLKDGHEPQWRQENIEGSWFPHAFIGSMSQVMLAAEGTINRPDNSVIDCIDTMACVEAAYQSSESGSIKVSYKK